MRMKLSYTTPLLAASWTERGSAVLRRKRFGNGLSIAGQCRDQQLSSACRLLSLWWRGLSARRERVRRWQWIPRRWRRWTPLAISDGAGAPVWHMLAPRVPYRVPRPTDPDCSRHAAGGKQRLVPATTGLSRFAILELTHIV